MTSTKEDMHVHLFLGDEVISPFEGIFLIYYIEEFPDLA